MSSKYPYAWSRRCTSTTPERHSARTVTKVARTRTGNETDYTTDTTPFTLDRWVKTTERIEVFFLNDTAHFSAVAPTPNNVAVDESQDQPSTTDNKAADKP